MMPIRKASFDQAEIWMPQESEVVDKKDSSAASTLGISACADTIETADQLAGNNGLINDMRDMFGKMNDWSFPEFPERFDHSKSLESASAAPTPERFGMSTSPDAINAGNDGDEFPQDNPLNNNMRGMLNDLGLFNRDWSFPDFPERFGQSKSVNSAAHDAPQESQNRTSIDQYMSGPRTDVSKSSLESIASSAISSQRLVEELLERIEQLLLSVPQDQQAYWVGLFEEKLKSYFTEQSMNSAASIVNNFRAMFGGGSSNGPVLYPRENIAWEAALEDFRAFFEQLQAAQQPTQVSASGEP